MNTHDLKRLGIRLLPVAQLISAAVLLAASTGSIAATFTDLGTSGGTYSLAVAINNSRQIVGASTFANTDDAHAALWKDGAWTDLGPLPGSTQSVAYGINAVGEIAGTSYFKDSPSRATLWKNGTANELPAFEEVTRANAINASGQVVGSTFWRGGRGSTRATLWSGSSVVYLPPIAAFPYSDFSEANGINDAGQIVGVSTGADGSGHATIWNDTVPTDLGMPIGSPIYGTSAQSINSAGQIVGWGIAEDANNHAISYAISWSGTVATVLGTLGGSYSQALNINEDGQIVGYSSMKGDSFVPHATLWKGAIAIDLNDYLDPATVSAGWYMHTAYAINDEGWITGVAHNTITGESHAFLLSPIPEPGTYVLLLAGLGMVAVATRRRKGMLC